MESIENKFGKKIYSIYLWSLHSGHELKEQNIGISDTVLRNNITNEVYTK